MQKILLTLRLGFFSLLLHKLRSGLAVLGILIGITAVIWLVALGEGDEEVELVAHAGELARVLVEHVLHGLAHVFLGVLRPERLIAI